MSQEEIKEEIAKLKEQMKEVKGSECEVYSRVCGYLRHTQSWNKGKQEEFAMRKLYDVGNGSEAHKASNDLHSCNMCKYKL